MVLRSSAGAYPQLESYLRKHHEWSNPEIVALPAVAGSRPYLQWVHGVTETAGEGG